MGPVSDNDKGPGLSEDKVSQLVKYERIETTFYRAKELQRTANKMVQDGKDGSLCAAKRAAVLPRGDAILDRLFTELAYRYRDRVGGRLLVRRRAGDAATDAARIAYVEFVDRDNELRRPSPPACQPPPPKVPLDPWERSKLCKQFAPRE